MSKHKQQNLDHVKEYERRVRAGLNPSPLIKHIDLEEIAGSDNLNRISEIEKLDQNSKTTIRGQQLTFFTPSKRLLWQAFGHEYIEPELLDFIDNIPEDEIYFDIGASNGIYALYAAAKGKKVTCFEPEVGNFSLLNYNTYLNKDNFRNEVKNFNIALSDSTGMGLIYVEKFEPGGHLKILESDMKRGEEKFVPEFKQAVLKYKLDDFLALTKIDPPSYVKIDVDGAEKQVLIGMENILRNNKLKKIFIELEEEGEVSTDCKNIIRKHGFNVESHKRVQNYFGLENFIFSR